MHTQALGVGGGFAGCSILYRLAKLGWTDVGLRQRDDLTSGSIWHATANINGSHANTNISKPQHYPTKLSRSLEVETGQGRRVFQAGSLSLTQTEAREYQLRVQEAKALCFRTGFHIASRMRWSLRNPY
ncbi:MAG: FAD-dependent oxidoreductase [Cypionkella sp.]